MVLLIFSATSAAAVVPTEKPIPERLLLPTPEPTPRPRAIKLNEGWSPTLYRWVKFNVSIFFSLFEIETHMQTIISSLCESKLYLKQSSKLNKQYIRWRWIRCLPNLFLELVSVQKSKACINLSIDIYTLSLSTGAHQLCTGKFGMFRPNAVQ